MEFENNIINALNEDFNKYELKHEEHKQRVLKAMDWWDEHFKGYNAMDKPMFENSLLEVNGVRCLCIRHQFTGIPYFVAEFIIKPLTTTGDIGNGAGQMKIVSF